MSYDMIKSYDMTSYDELIVLSILNRQAKISSRKEK